MKQRFWQLGLYVASTALSLMQWGRKNYSVQKGSNGSQINFLTSCLLPPASCLLVILGNQTARANLILSPIYLDLTVNRGKAEGVLNVSNSGNEPIRVRLSTTSFTYNRDGEFQQLSKSDGDLTPYLQYSPREIVIEPGKVRRVRLFSVFPPSLPDGEYRVAIFAETLSSGTTQNGYRVNLISRVGSAIYVRKGEISPDLKVQQANFNAEKQQLRLLIQNQGRATARPQIKWGLQQGGNLLASETIGTSLLAGLEQNVLLNRSTQNKLKLPAGKYQVIGEVTWQDGNQQKQLPFNLDLVVP